MKTALMKPSSSRELKFTVYAALMAALMAAGAYIAVPIGPVPIVLQNFFVLLAGLLLGSRWGSASVAVYLFLGACGLPVFAGGAGGIGRFAGPTGGYLLGYLPAVYLVGRIKEKTPETSLYDLGALTVGVLTVYACGVPWLKMVTGMPWDKAIAVGMIPFLIGDGLKVAAALPAARLVRPFIGKI